MKAKQMLSLTNMLEKIITDMDDLKQMINDLRNLPNDVQKNLKHTAHYTFDIHGDISFWTYQYSSKRKV